MTEQKGSTLTSEIPQRPEDVSSGKEESAAKKTVKKTRSAVAAKKTADAPASGQRAKRSEKKTAETTGKTAEKKAPAKTTPKKTLPPKNTIVTDNAEGAPASETAPAKNKRGGGAASAKTAAAKTRDTPAQPSETRDKKKAASAPSAAESSEKSTRSSSTAKGRAKKAAVQDAPPEAPAAAPASAEAGSKRAGKEDKEKSRRSRTVSTKKAAAARKAAGPRSESLDDARPSDLPLQPEAAAFEQYFTATVEPAAESAGGNRVAVRAELPDMAAAQPGAPEHIADETAEAAPEESGGEEKKRRGRSRRGGRNRKKTSAANAARQTESETVEKPDDNAAARSESGKQDATRTELPPEGQKKSRAGETGEEVALPKAGRRKMFVSVLPEEQVEVVITEEGQVQEYYVEMLHQAKAKGNIYKGIIHNVDPNLQAAFVSYGAAKNGFLQIDEVHPEYYVASHEVGKGHKYPLIQKVLKPGQEVLVQVVKEPAGTKGAFLTTYLSLPGRFLVLTPGREQIGVSRKVEDESERARLRELLEGLSPGPGLGVIVRTVSMGGSKTNLQKDLQYLKRTWKEVRTRGTTENAPCLVYQEVDLTSRAVRDYLTETVTEVWVDDEKTAGAVTEIAGVLFPRKTNFVRVHKEPSSTLFERFNIQRQLDQIHSRDVSLPSGGRLVIDPTEALTAIDINSGRSGGKNNFEDMAYRTNMEAARMIPLQLRLRDIGGQIVVDFIEMRDKSHWREVEKILRTGMKIDRARHDVGKVGPFGMLEIVRQRLGSSAISISIEPCPCCNGTGVRRNMEWRCQRALRDIQRSLRSAQAQEQTVVFFPTDAALALHLLNHKRQRLVEMERAFAVRLEIQIKAQESL